MLRIIDRYILKNFIKTLILTFFAFYAITLVIDCVEKVDTFVDKKAEIADILLYFYYALPNFIIIIMPIALLMASLFTMGQFVRFGELTALKAAGVSLYRIVFPLLLFGIFISVLSFWFDEIVVTASERERTRVFDINIKKSNTLYLRKENILLQDTKDRVISIALYDGPNHIGRNVNIQERFENRIILTLSAEEIVPSDGDWVLKKGKIRDFASGEEVIREFDEYRITDFTFTEKDIVSEKIEPEEMNSIELLEYIEKLERIGNPYNQWFVDYYKKFAFPFANLIVILLGLPLATKKWKGGAAVGFGVCIFICFTYYSLMTFTHAMGYKGTMTPVMAAWSSNVIFGALGLTILIKAQK
jgi:lipopolysaccharide export system permease protein